MGDEDRKGRSDTPLQTQQTRWEDIIKIIVEKSPDPLSKIVDALRGHPEQIKAEYKLTMTTTISFIILMFVIVGITSYLAIIGKLGGDTVAFIFGTAFGSVITFLYRYLSPGTEE